MTDAEKRRRLEKWAQSEGADERSTLIFLSLPSEIRERVRSQGSLKNGRNRSALLMARIRQEFPGFVELDSDAQVKWNEGAASRMRAFAAETLLPMVWLIVRGESHRTGVNHEHGTGGSDAQFRSNMVSYLDHLVTPLEQAGFQVCVAADIRSPDLAEEKTESTFKNVFGKRVRYIRAQPEMLGDSQVASLKGAFDTMRHQLRLRKQFDDILGVYIVRADVQLLMPGLEEWPKDRMCFPWRTLDSRIGGGINDVLFYVPQSLLMMLRAPLENPQWVVNLHWLEQEEAVRQRMWLMMESNHPSNTARNGNPYYRITARQEGPVDEGKFMEHRILQAGHTAAGQRGDRSAGDIQALWSRRVQEVMKLWFTTEEFQRRDNRGPDSMDIGAFKTWWYRAFPGDLVDAFMTRPRHVMRSLNDVSFIAADQKRVYWRSGLHAEEECGACQLQRWSAPRQVCFQCGQVSCMACMSFDDIKTGLRCEICVSASPAPKKMPRRSLHEASASSTAPSVFKYADAPWHQKSNEPHWKRARRL